MQEMLWLPDPKLRDYTHKLVLDFLLLMCTCRQMLVFRIEKQYENSDFPGGSNKSVVDEINKLGSGDVPIETHDFVSIQKNWLDILKCIVFLGCFWITLAIVFLAGSRNVNIYSIGYLIGSFVFLWQGGEYYLRPIYTILRWWKLLVAYNVFVIALKAFLHLPVCLFINWLEEEWKYTCFFIKVFGITCAQNGITLGQMEITELVSNHHINKSIRFIVTKIFLNTQSNLLLRTTLVIFPLKMRVLYGILYASCSWSHNYAFSRAITSVISSMKAKQAQSWHPGEFSEQ